MPAPRRVDPERYWSLAWAAREASLWSRVWLPAAHEHRLVGPGAFVTTTVGGVDVLVLRGDDGVLRAFRNACAHRGRRLVEASHGTLEGGLRCPLHHWSYGLDGRVSDVPSRGSFGGLADGAGLCALPCEAWCGHVFVHLGEPEETLAAWLAPLEAGLSRHRLDDLALVDVKTFALACNWKTIADLFNEAYHVPAVHPYLLGSVDPASVRSAIHGPHVEQTFAIGRPAAGQSPTEVTDSLRDLVRDVGADPAALAGDATNAPGLIREALRARGLTELGDDELLEGKSWYVFPALTLNVYPHGAQVHRPRPDPRDPERCWLDQLTFARLGGTERPAIRVSSYDGIAEGSGRVTEDDLAEAIEVQRGLRSARELLVGEREAALAHMHDELERHLGE
ncbi:MAG: Rieske 2Fe-2S domain-containing protein [Myxococcales bacterium]|nr:Rieske 2Fe-2S domain-containing protein [Myxococcales bacterium]